MAGQEIMKTESDIPRLEGSPFAPTEVVNGQDLSAEDHSFLQKREKIIEAGRKTFLEVGGALIDIHDYRSGYSINGTALLMPTANSDGISAALMLIG